VWPLLEPEVVIGDICSILWFFIRPVGIRIKMGVTKTRNGKRNGKKNGKRNGMKNGMKLKNYSSCLRV
jgi:hypothetical protein